MCPFAGCCPADDLPVPPPVGDDSYDFAIIKDDISGFYYSVAEPLLERAGLSPSEKGFRHAYALVSSRAFMVDAYHGLAMVPIADA